MTRRRRSLFEPASLGPSLLGLWMLAGCSDTPEPQADARPSVAPAPAAMPTPGAPQDAGLEVSLLQDGRELPLPDTVAAEVLTAALALFASCTDRERQLVAEPDWQAARSAGRCLQLSADGGRSLDVAVMPGLRFTELLLPLDDPTGRLYARDGATIFSAFSGCDAALRDALRRAVP